MKNAATTSTTKPRALIVPAEVLALEGITLTAKLILAEVMDLYKVKKHVFASDEYFATRLGIGLRTVGDAIKQLHEYGFLARAVDPKARHKRQLTPTLSLPSATNMSTKSLRNPQANATHVPADSATNACEIRQKSLHNSQGVPAKSADINTRVNSTSISNSIQGEVAAQAATSPQEKKLDEEKSSGSALTATPSSPLVAARPPSSPQTVAAASHQPTQALLAQLRFPKAASDQLREAFTLWVCFRQQRGRPLNAASFQLQLDELAQYHEEFSLPLISTAIKNGNQGLTYSETHHKYTTWLTTRHTSSAHSAKHPATLHQRQHAPVNVSYGHL